MNLDELELLSDHEIDYEALPDPVLRDLTLRNDLFKATSALVTLSQRGSKYAEMLASDIIAKGLGDRFLQGAAINVLFDFNPAKALEFVTKEIRTGDLYVFNSILELMLDHQAYFGDGDRIWLTEIATQRLTELNETEKWPTAEVKERFLATYPSRLA
jgi:hypothetical protein